MTRRAKFVGALSLLAVAAFGWFAMRDSVLADAACHGDVQAWMRHEFKLDDPTLRRIAALQKSFETECEEHCRKVAEAKSALGAAPSPASRERLAHAREACRLSRVEHVRAVAACMPPEAAKAYLELVLPKVEAADHVGAPDLSGHTRGR